MKRFVRAIADRAESIKPSRALAVIFLLALGLRLANSDLWSRTLSYATFPFLDEMGYDSLARNLLEFGRFAAFTEGNLFESLRPPVYPLFLAGIYAALGRSFVLVRVLQALLDSCSCLLLYGIASRLSLRVGLSLLAALCYAVYGPAIHMCAFLTGEILALFLLNLSLFCLLRSRAVALVVGAVLFGVLIHCRPAFLGVIPFYAAAAAVVAGPGRKHRAAAIVLAAIALTCAPWGIRNLVVHRTVVPVSTVPAWHVLSSGQGAEDLRIEETRKAFFSHSHLTEGQMCALGTRIGMRCLLANPVAGFAKGMARILHSWTFPNWYNRFWRPRAYVNIVRAGPVAIPTIDFEGVAYVTAVFLAIGCVRVRKISASVKWLVRAAIPVILVGIGYVLFHVLSIPLIQYRFMMEPCFMLLAIAFAACVCGGSPRDERTDPTDERDSRLLSRRTHVALGVLGVAALCLVSIGLCRFRSRARHKMKAMRALLPGKEGASIREVRTYQFGHGGELGPFIGKEVAWVGELAYPAEGFRFDPVPTYANSKPEATPDSSVFRLNVSRYDSNNPLGTGDVRVNIPTRLANRLTAGAIVEVTGRIAGMTCYGAIIVNAEGLVDHSELIDRHE